MAGALEVVEGDVRDRAAVAAAVRGCDRVLHLAAIASVVRSFDDPATTAAVNVDGTANVLAAASAEGARRVVLASSCAVYGAAAEPPVAETAATHPESPYARSKLAAEELCPGGRRRRWARCRRPALLQRVRAPPGPLIGLLGRDRLLHGARLGRAPVHGVRRRAPEPRLHLRLATWSPPVGRRSTGEELGGAAGQRRHGGRDEPARPACGARRGERPRTRRRVRRRPRRRHPALVRGLRSGSRAARLRAPAWPSPTVSVRPGPGTSPGTPPRRRPPSRRRATARRSEGRQWRAGDRSASAA